MSGSWYDNLPDNWNAKRVAALLVERKEKNDPIQTDFILSLSAKYGVLPYSERIEKGGNRPKGDLTKYAIARKGDLLVNCMNILAGSSGVTKWDGAISPVYYALYPRNNEANIDYYSYIFRLVTFYRGLIGLGKGILFHETESGALNTIRLRIPMTSLNNVYLPLPPRQEQDQIVRYLDWKVSQINRLINTKRRQIVFLKEQYTIFVNETVSKIADTWEVLRAKYLFSERDERSELGEEPHLSMSQKFGLVRQDKLEERRTVSVSYVGAKVCYENDIVLNRLKAHLGVFALAPEKGVISPDYTVLRPNTSKIIPKYAEYYLKSDACRKELRIRVRGVVEGFWRLYTDDFNTIPIPTPPLEEQETILALLQDKTDKHGKVIIALENEITLLTEYRTSLISDVVTGKIDVQSVTVPEYTVEEETPDVSEETDEMEADE